MEPQQSQNNIDLAIKEHIHDGNLSQRINWFDLFGNKPGQIPFSTATIATTGNTDGYIIVPNTGNVTSIDFSGVDALATSDTNYITWTVTNLGQTGGGSTVLLATSPAGINTTKTTGGTAIVANTKYSFALSGVPNATQVVEGDRLKIRAAVTGTLANTVTFPTYIIRFN